MAVDDRARGRGIRPTVFGGVNVFDLPPPIAAGALLLDAIDARNHIFFLQMPEPIQPVDRLTGQLIDRSKGEYGLRAPSSKELMETVPEWPAYIRSITGWARVEPGTLTLVHTKPLPGPGLANVEALGSEPSDLFDNIRPDYGEFLRKRRGQRRYYGGLACSATKSHVAIVSFQDAPPSPDWLDVYSNEKLRDVLNLQTGDFVTVEIFNATDWTDVKK